MIAVEIITNAAPVWSPLDERASLLIELGPGASVEHIRGMLHTIPGVRRVELIPQETRELTSIPSAETKDQQLLVPIMSFPADHGEP